MTVEKLKRKISEIRQRISPVLTLAEPAPEHYSAFMEAGRKIRDYLQDETIDDPVGKRETEGFIFCESGMEKLTPEQFEREVVKACADRRLPEKQRPVCPTNPQRKIYPEFFYFVMDGDKIAGIVSASPKILSDDDRRHKARRYRPWSSLAEGKGCGVVTSALLLPEYRGRGLIAMVKEQFFEKLSHDYGVKEVMATVLPDNGRSNGAQENLRRKYPGSRAYQTKVYFAPAGEMPVNRYLIPLPSRR